MKTIVLVIYFYAHNATSVTSQIMPDYETCAVIRKSIEAQSPTRGVVFAICTPKPDTDTATQEETP